MAVFSYQIYYAYKPSISNPLLDELNQEEVGRNIGLLIDDLKSHFGDIGGSVDSSSNGFISITVDLTQKECDKIIKGYLSPLNLLAKKVKVLAQKL